MHNIQSKKAIFHSKVYYVCTLIFLWNAIINENIIIYAYIYTTKL